MATEKVSITSSGIFKQKSRWAQSFGEMSESDVVEVLNCDPFRRICGDLESAKKELFNSFGVSVSIYGILKNDARLHTYRKGEIIVGKGDYGNTAFFLIDGLVSAVLSPDLPPSALRQRESRKRNFLRSFAANFKSSFLPTIPENLKQTTKQGGTEVHGRGKLTGLLFDQVHNSDEYETHRIQPGEIFGEGSAIYRTPRSASVVASERSRVLEIRWQGLRDLIEADEEIATRIDDVYRARALQSALEHDELFRNIPSDKYDLITFHAFGKYDEWSGDYIDFSAEEKHAAIEQEEIIVEEGGYPDGVFVVCTGFVRVCKRFGIGYQTRSYLGKGMIFGLSEAIHNWNDAEHPVSQQYSLRAIGYTHVLHIPTQVMEKYVLPDMDQETQIERDDIQRLPDTGDQKYTSNSTGNMIYDDVFEFLAQNRYLNGTQTMLINTDRCTRCDDCVGACADAHDGNPRFVRQGPVSNHVMVVNACMHCVDPVCMIGCPTGAIHRESQGGQVVINTETCIGCSTCYNNCPYDAIRMVTVRDNRGEFRITALGADAGKPVYKATKCDLCVDLQGGPACVRACPHDAMARVNMQNKESIAKFVAL
ncbi:MAG: cyclic nucleotide-binding domain-containing protein [Candidatus Hydrogenedentota bacterium]